MKQNLVKLKENHLRQVILICRDYYCVNSHVTRGEFSEFLQNYIIRNAYCSGKKLATSKWGMIFETKNFQYGLSYHKLNGTSI